MSFADHPEVSVTYFIPDERKSGGAYVTVTGIVKKVDDCQRLLLLTDGTKIPLDEILELEKEGQILVIRPEVCNVKTLERDAEAMQAFYEHGYAIGEAWLPKIRAYLGEE